MGIGSFVVMMLQTSMRKKLWYDLLAVILLAGGIFLEVVTWKDNQEQDGNKSECERQLDEAIESDIISDSASINIILIGIIVIITVLNSNH